MQLSCLSSPGCTAGSTLRASHMQLPGSALFLQAPSLLAAIPAGCCPARCLPFACLASSCSSTFPASCSKSLFSGSPAPCGIFPPLLKPSLLNARCVNPLPARLFSGPRLLLPAICRLRLLWRCHARASLSPPANVGRGE